MVSKKILIIDDEQDLVSALEYFFKKEGYNVVVSTQSDDDPIYLRLALLEYSHQAA